MKNRPLKPVIIIIFRCVITLAHVTYGNESVIESDIRWKSLKVAESRWKSLKVGESLWWMSVRRALPHIDRLGDFTTLPTPLRSWLSQYIQPIRMFLYFLYFLCCCLPCFVCRWWSHLPARAAQLLECPLEAAVAVAVDWYLNSVAF